MKFNQINIQRSSPTEYMGGIKLLVDGLLIYKGDLYILLDI